MKADVGVEIFKGQGTRLEESPAARAGGWQVTPGSGREWRGRGEGTSGIAPLLSLCLAADPALLTWGSSVPLRDIGQCLKQRGEAIRPQPHSGLVAELDLKPRHVRSQSA